VNAIAAATHPIGRCGNIYETGKTIAWLASDDASFITGVTLRVDGGAYHAGPKFEPLNQ
jgi:NAD(P)-dependent dehydrogenase (short-subunit alcohol dehydrogenase family)